MSFPFVRQFDSMDCGPACLKMILESYGSKIHLETIRKMCNISKNGVSLKSISLAAEILGIRTLGVKIPYGFEKNSVGLLDFALPAIAHYNKNHFVVVYKVNKEMYGNSYSTPSYSTPSHSQPKQERNYNNGGQLKMQNGYMKSNGTYVEPHLKTTPDNNKLNNKSSWD